MPWSSDTDAIPRDGTMVLMRHPDWECPAVVHWDETYRFWAFSEELISNAEGELVSLDQIEWVHIPGTETQTNNQT